MQNGENLQGRVDFGVADDISCVYAHYRGYDIDVLAFLVASGMIVCVGGRRMEKGCGVSLERIRVVFQVGSTIAIAVVVRRIRHDWEGWGMVVGWKLD
jgi:hypothetical protein